MKENGPITLRQLADELADLRDEVRGLKRWAIGVVGSVVGSTTVAVILLAITHALR